MRKFIVAVAALVLAGPALAEAPSGDIAAGEGVFKKQCAACHVVVDADGETLAGKRGRQGPNLYGVPMHHVGKVEDFRYGKPMMAASEVPDLIWTEAEFVTYVQDPSAWLTDKLGKKSRSKMTHKVRKEQDALDVYAFIHSLTPAE
ncbi:c-type cytochrome [Rhodobacteraceae bacterium KMM 6894]|nr:c-type cytochrome [Rhodobacteraceae bacterium KMM 6894]